MDTLDMNLVDWSRAQFALTAIYHWLFVPLTLGLSFIVAFMETIYVKTENPEWKRITKFWMTLFGINFAIGVATGIILEFEFGTNWSNYSWFVGDIFGAPLAIEGILAFFLESTFIAVMFFGWEKVSKRFHLISSWLVAFGANLSALWILVANGWMNSPVGMAFNPETGRNEMTSFWEVLLSPFAINKFLHTISSGFVVASCFVLGISAWYLIKNREHYLAKRSMIVATVFGLITTVFLALTGDLSAKIVAEKQPMKFASFEGLYQGQTHAPLVFFALVSPYPDTTKNNEHELFMEVKIPHMLSFLTHKNPASFVPGINDLVDGNVQQNIMSAREKIERGKVARETLKAFQLARENRTTNPMQYAELKATFADSAFQNNYFKYFGYSFFNNPKDLIPSVPGTFYSFHIMVYIGGLLLLLFLTVFWFIYKKKDYPKWLLHIALWSIPLPYLASQTGWVLAELGRQPWAIQDYLPTKISVSHLSVSSVQLTFWLFAAIFTLLLVAEIAIMVKQIKLGSKEGGNSHA
jgi:cytochrome d ubiquinol oxidase subunit I